MSSLLDNVCKRQEPFDPVQLKAQLKLTVEQKVVTDLFVTALFIRKSSGRGKRNHPASPNAASYIAASCRPWWCNYVGLHRRLLGRNNWPRQGSVELSIWLKRINVSQDYDLVLSRQGD